MIWMSRASSHRELPWTPQVHWGDVLNEVNNRLSNSQSIPIWLPIHNTRGMGVVFIAINVKALVNNTTVQLVITRALEGSP
jgi:hypothetical protein